MLYSNKGHRIAVAGATCRGGLHKKTASANQDYFFIKKFYWGILCVAADGLGSKNHAGTGAKAVCRACVKAAQSWVLSRNRDVNALLTAIRAQWLDEIKPLNEEDCASTCIFAVYFNTNDILLAQLGDGIRKFSGTQQ